MSMIDYSHSPRGVLVLSYHKQVERSKKRGMQLPTYTVQEFRDRFLNDPKYMDLFNQWKENGFNTNDRPSFDRINPDLGYTMDNIQVVTWKENRKKGDRENSDRGTIVIMTDLNGNEIREFKTIKQASAETGISVKSISGCCLGKIKQVKGYVFKYRGNRFRIPSKSKTQVESANVGLIDKARLLNSLKGRHDDYEKYENPNAALAIMFAIDAIENGYFDIIDAGMNVCPYCLGTGIEGLKVKGDETDAAD